MRRDDRPAVPPIRRVLTALIVLSLLALGGTVYRIESAGGTSSGHQAPHRETGNRSGHPGSSTPASPASPATAPTEPPLPVTPVAWTPCGDDLQCGSVTVPLDYSHPGGETIQIAVERHPAEIPSERIGSLVINPGGPGTSGIDDLPNELSVLTSGLLDRFDVVSFDPRGVQRSSPVTCPATPGPTSTPPTQTTPLERPDPVPTGATAAAAEQALLANDRAFASQCEAQSGSILPYVGTVDTARDLDRIRQALGDAKLTFIGHSYGTFLGAVYAQMFPTHVRAMVLDSAVDPALGTDQYIIDQAGSLETALGNFLSWCSSSHACAWSTGSDPTASLLALIQKSRESALPAANGQEAGPGEIYDALLGGLDSSSSWPTLGEALAEAAQGNGTGIVDITDSYATGGSSNGGDAEQAIDCLDHPVSRDPSTYPALAAQAAVEAPVFGPLLAWGWLGCAVWPVPADRTPAPTTAAGAPPILVTGTTDDPATPYRWAVHLASELQHGELVTWRGTSHVAYFYSPCVRAIDQAYLIDLTLPPQGTVCSD